MLGSPCFCRFPVEDIGAWCIYSSVRLSEKNVVVVVSQYPLLGTDGTVGPGGGGTGSEESAVK